MSKSKKNGIDPFSLIDYLGSDVFRYFLISEKQLGYNYDFYIERFVEKINCLPNQLGNLLNRSLKMIEIFVMAKYQFFLHR